MRWKMDVNVPHNLSQIATVSERQWQVIKEEYKGSSASLTAPPPLAQKSASMVNPDVACTLPPLSCPDMTPAFW